MRRNSYTPVVQGDVIEPDEQAQVFGATHSLSVLHAGVHIARMRKFDFRMNLHIFV